jgi:ribosomal protein S27AE
LGGAKGPRRRGRRGPARWSTNCRSRASGSPLPWRVVSDVEHFCPDCGASLNFADHTPGTDRCPGCGSTNFSLTVTPGTVRASAAIPRPGIESLLDWSSVWLAIARENVAAAHAARARYATEPSRALAAEFHAGLTAVGAAAFAVEAETLNVIGGEPKAKTPPKPHSRSPNKGDWLGQHLLEAGSGDAALASSLGELFRRRNASVHPAAAFAALALHPVGTNTSLELVEYTAEVAAESLSVAEQAVRALSPKQSGTTP